MTPKICTAQTYRGGRCRNQAEAGTDRCIFHPSTQPTKENQK